MRWPNPFDRAAALIDEVCSHTLLIPPNPLSLSFCEGFAGTTNVSPFSYVRRQNSEQGST